MYEKSPNLTDKTLTPAGSVLADDKISAGQAESEDDTAGDILGKINVIVRIRPLLPVDESI